MKLTNRDPMRRPNSAPKPSWWRRFKRKFVGEKRYHVAAANIALMHTSDQFLERFVLPHLYTEELKNPTPVEFRRMCLDAHAKGYEVLPACGNVDAKGTCRGH